jgi:predicted enzyme related to lactoylglutathione lyase
MTAGTLRGVVGLQLQLERRTAMSFQNALAGVAVRNLGSAERWYQTLLGRRADSKPMPEVAEWRFERGGWIQVFHDERRAGSSSVTLAVDDLDETLERLSGQGVEIKSKNVSKVVKTAILSDPDGNQIVLAQALTGDIAH